MTSIPLTFAINSIKQTIHVFSVGQPLSADSLATNINFVEWDAGKGYGTVIYNDRIALPEQFTDPSPYQTYINEWMTAAAAASTPLTLAQAQAVKSSLVDSIWSIKSKALVSVATSQGTFSFDTNPSDPTSVLNPTVLLAAISSTSTELAAMNSAIETLASTINSEVNNSLSTANAIFNEADNSDATIVSYTNSVIANLVNQLQTYVEDTGNLPFFTSPGGVTWSSFGGSIGGIGVSYSPPAGLAGVTAPVKMLPIGSTTYPAFTLADMFAVLSAAKTQIDNEAAARAVKQAAIAALSTVASAISYDATTGW